MSLNYEKDVCVGTSGVKAMDVGRLRSYRPIATIFQSRLLGPSIEEKGMSTFFVVVVSSKAHNALAGTVVLTPNPKRPKSLSQQCTYVRQKT